METGSESSRCELDSMTSADSLQMITDEFRLHHLATPDVTNAELSKRVAALELDNERLRIELENARLELNAKNAANQGLKNKIAELYMEAQTSLQEKQKLQNAVKDAKSCLAAAESSAKWYQGQMHEVQASKKSLQVEIDTYQSILRQKHQTLVSVTAKWKQLNEDYSAAVQKHKHERDSLQAQIELSKTKDNCLKVWDQQPMVPMAAYEVCSTRLEAAEEELQDTRAELRALEQRWSSLEAERAELEAGMAKQRCLLASTEDVLTSCRAERAQLADVTAELRLQLARLANDNEAMQLGLLDAKQHRQQVEDAIEQLRSQLTKMIAQHKLLKCRNAELEEKLNAMQDVCNENKRLKSLSYSANASLFRRLRQERRKNCALQKQLCHEQVRRKDFSQKAKTEIAMKECLKQALERNKELKELLKCAKVLEESVDEGYADGSALSLTATLPSPRPLSPYLLDAIDDVLKRSKNFWEPVQLGLNELHAKLQLRSPSASLVSTPPATPPSTSRSVA